MRRIVILLLLTLPLVGCGAKSRMSRELKKFEESPTATTMVAAKEAFDKASEFVSYFAADGKQGEYPELASRAHALHLRRAREFADISTGAVKERLEKLVDDLANVDIGSSIEALKNFFNAETHLSPEMKAYFGSDTINPLSNDPADWR